MLDDLQGLARESLSLVLLVSAPILAVGLAVGLLMGVLQTLTQVQEQTLSFVPKLFAVMVMLLIAGPWIGAELMSFTSYLWTSIADVSR